MVARLPQRLKSTLFEIFSNGGCPKGTRSVEKISNNIDFSLWGNRATTWEYFLTFSSETKIMKIRHSVLYIMLLPSSICFFIFKKCDSATAGMSCKIICHFVIYYVYNIEDVYLLIHFQMCHSWKCQKFWENLKMTLLKVSFLKVSKSKV